jgi:hypothetical protein
VRLAGQSCQACGRWGGGEQSRTPSRRQTRTAGLSRAHSPMRLDAPLPLSPYVAAHSAILRQPDSVFSPCQEPASLPVSSIATAACRLLWASTPIVIM